MATFFRLRHLAACLLALALASVASAQCTGDCNDDGSVAINELIVGVNIALGSAAVSGCPSFDVNSDGSVAINELIAAVNAALNGCPATPTPEATGTATDTATVAEPTATEPPPPTATAVDTLTATPVETNTATATVASTSTGTAVATATPIDTSTATAVTTATAVNTATASPLATAVDTATPPATATAVATNTAVVTATAPPSATATDVVAAATATETPSPTPTQPAVTATFTPTPTPTSGSAAVCGNGFLEPGESCASCVMDCMIGPCTATATMTSFTIQFSSPLGTIPTTGTFLLGYRSNHVSLPGSATATSVRQRVTYPAPLPNVASVNDLDYALRLVVGRNGGLNNGLLATVRFDTCQGAAAVTEADFGCTVEACAGAGGAIDDCACSVEAP